MPVEKYIIEAVQLPVTLGVFAKAIGRSKFGTPRFWMKLAEYRVHIGRLVTFLSKVYEGYEVLLTPLSRLAPDKKKQPGLFENVMAEMSRLFMRVKSSSLAQLKLLTTEETERLDEAFHCLMERGYWSAIVNSAVSLESRLFLILIRRNKQVLVNIQPDLRFPLGALADAYLRNTDKFGKCVPKVHENLLKLVNEYRIVSAHAKQFKVDKRTADSVFNLTLEFLLDKECEPPKKRGRPKRTAS